MAILVRAFGKDQGKQSPDLDTIDLVTVVLNDL